MTDAETAMNTRDSETNQVGLDEVRSDAAVYMELQHGRGAVESQYCQLEPSTQQSAPTSHHATSATDVIDTGREYANVVRVPN